MASNATDQSTKRAILAALLTTKLIGSGKPTQQVYAEAPESFQEQICVAIEDSDIEGRKTITNDTTSVVWFHYDVHVFVLWNITGSSAVRSLIEKNVADVLKDNLSTSDWTMIEYAGNVTAGIDKPYDKGPFYRHGIIPIRIQVYDGLTP